MEERSLEVRSASQKMIIERRCDSRDREEFHPSRIISCNDYDTFFEEGACPRIVVFFWTNASSHKKN
eukprot:scaffold162125_cov78-Attheya_sp.AAC.7